jgi:hypothetical protein
MAILIAGLALGLAVFALVLVGLIIIGAQREAPWSALDPKPPTPLAAFARNVLGLHVRKTPSDTLRSAGRQSKTPAIPNGRR